jgi:cell division protein DivIC
MKILSNIPPVLKNKYVLTIIGFAIWMVFVDRNDFITQIGRFNKQNELNRSKIFNDDRIKNVKSQLEKRENDPSAYERLARENYYMKRDNEDIFLFNE